MVNFYMVGTVHIDTKGPSRLERFLNMVRPDTIGIECREPDLATVRKFLPQKEFRVLDLALYMKLGMNYSSSFIAQTLELYRANGFEITVPLLYEKNSPPSRLLACDHYTDSDSEFRLKLKKLRIFGSLFNVSVHSHDVFIDYVRDVSDVPADFHYGSLSYIDFENKAGFLGLYDRDEFAERKIRDAITQCQYTFVYIGGAAHMFGRYHNLYERLKDLKPHRLMLNDVDRF